MKLLQVLIYLNLFFLQSYLVRFNIAGYPSNLQEVLILSAALLFLILNIKNGKLITTIKNLAKYKVIGFFVVGAIVFSTLVPIENRSDLLHYLKFTFFGALFTFIALETFVTPEDRTKAIKIGGLGALAFGLFSVIYNLTGHNIALDHRLLGPLDAAVYLAYYLTPFFIFFAIQSLEKSPIPKIHRQNIIFALLLAILIIATRSMGSIAGSFIVIAIYIFTHSKLILFRNKKTKVMLTLIAVAIFGTIFQAKILPTLKYTNSSLDERGEIWKTSAYLLEDPKENLFFGLGLGQFQENYATTVDTALDHPPLDYIVLQPHNIFLLFVFNYGIAGIAALLIFIIYLLKNLRTPEACILLYFLIHGLIDTPFFKNDLLLLIMLFAEIALAKHKPSKKPHNV